jgi:PAS domain S-box-containing protein
MDLLAMIHPQLRLALHTAIRTAQRDHAATSHENLVIEIAGGMQRLTLIVRPLAELGPDSGLLLVIFHELGPPVSVAQAQASGLFPQTDDPIAQQLAQELQTTRDALETTIAELQETNAELKSANEELLSINEELQSANEELQTSKEEIQSINEELQTVNAELNRKVEELDRVNGDLQNLLASTQIPAIFLHADGRIARFTPAATEVFRLIESDSGRPITDITARFRAGDLLALVREVLRTLTPYEAPVRRAESDTWWSMHIRPYRTLANVIDGVVITFADITNLKQAAAERERLLAAVQQARLFAERIVETVRQPLLVLDTDQRVRLANRAFYKTFQVTPAEIEQRRLYDLGGQQWDRPEIHAQLDAILAEHAAFEDVTVTHTFPHIGLRTMLLNARPIEQPLDDAPSILLVIEDITERAQAAAALQQAHDLLEERVQERTRALAAANATLRAEIGERARAEHARQLLLQQLVTAQEEERAHIARELHDQMGQDLTALMLGLKTLRDAAAAESPVHTRLEQVHALAIKIGREVRSLAVQLRPPALDELGLVATLANEVELWSARALIAVDFQPIGLDEQRLPAAIETTLYRVAQEALTNVLKHAQATRVSLIIERRVDAVHMIVEDNGAGFDADAVRQTAHAEHRLGLVGMAERVAHAGGTLTIESTTGRGTEVFVRIPLIGNRHGGGDDETPDLSGR